MIIGLLMVSTFVVLLNEMMLGVALPTLIADLDITPTTGQWLTTGYLLTLAVLIPATGFVMRRFTTRAIFLGSMSLFLIGTVIAVIAPGFGVLLAGRIIQAVGTAVFVPLLITTTMRLVPVSRRGRMMALVTAVPAIAPAVGPAVSGLILSQLSWRWLFILMLPIIVATLILGAVKLRNVTVPERATLDVVSLLLSIIGFGGLVFGLASIGESVSGHAPVAPYIPLLIGLIGVGAFVYRQIRLQRQREAFLDTRIFKTRAYVLPTIVMTFVAMNGFGVVLVLPLILTAVLGLNTLQMGLFLFPGGAMIAIVSALGGRVYDKVGPKPLAIPGSIIWAASIWFLTTIDENTSVWLALGTYLVITGTQALMWAPMTTSALGSLPTELYSHGTAASPLSSNWPAPPAARSSSPPSPSERTQPTPERSTSPRASPPDGPHSLSPRSSPSVPSSAHCSSARPAPQPTKPEQGRKRQCAASGSPTSGISVPYPDYADCFGETAARSIASMYRVIESRLWMRKSIFSVMRSRSVDRSSRSPGSAFLTTIVCG
ncbi:DHA2 family efflux MFS transporter permease subunit [Arthrobacter jinronghuae]|nr:DHA2 family efflux MFS transporter permease subunit [Arthrobacter jinronghuae]UWX77384.1 DHA2 family efflux MFS transporter permease subunit [Arthrobacter jinronghuae]